MEKIDTIDFITIQKLHQENAKTSHKWDNTWTYLTDEGVLSWIHKELNKKRQTHQIENGQISSKHTLQEKEIQIANKYMEKCLTP